MKTRRLPRILEFHLGALWDRVREIPFVVRRPSRRLAHQTAQCTVPQLDAAIELGASYLRACQTADGIVRGFLLAPGASTSWLTAHAAFALERVPECDDFCRRAAQGLAATGASDGGWGFNRRIGIDGDSTAQAVMVLERFHIPVPDFIVRALAATQDRGGGFPTYARQQRSGAGSHGWHQPHADVSALVGEALRRHGAYDSQVTACAGWLRRRLIDGVLPSYWWEGESYGLWLQHRTPLVPAIRHQRARRVLASASTGAPQLAMTLAALTPCCGYHRLRGAAATLLSEQHADGSWPCNPCLRVTSRHERREAFHLPGTVARDRRRVFSTAHSVAALHEFRELVLAGSGPSPPALRA